MIISHIKAIKTHNRHKVAPDDRKLLVHIYSMGKYKFGVFWFQVRGR